MAAEKKERTSLFTPIGRACFVHLWEPHAIEEGKEKKFSITLVFDAEKAAELKQLKVACYKAAAEKFGKSVDDVKSMVKKGKLRMPWRPGSDYEEYGEPFSDEGAVFISLSSRNAPGVVNSKAKQILNQNEIYSGMFARASCGVWAYDTKGNKGVTLLLNNVQKTGEGERLSGRMDAEEEFDSVDGGDGDDDDDDDDEI